MTPGGFRESGLPVLPGLPVEHRLIDCRRHAGTDSMFAPYKTLQVVTCTPFSRVCRERTGGVLYSPCAFQAEIKKSKVCQINNFEILNSAGQIFKRLGTKHCQSSNGHNSSPLALENNVFLSIFLFGETKRFRHTSKK